MEVLLSNIQSILDKINAFVWGIPMLTLLVGMGIYLTFKLGFLQRYVFKALKLSFVKDNSQGIVSNFGAFAVSFSGIVGTGNIIGVATAITSGGPGALFWMMLSGFFGIATKYAECLLGVQYRVKNSYGEIVGGPMYYIERGLKLKWLAVIFTLGTILMGFGSVLLQSNSIGDTLKQIYAVAPWKVGLVISSLVGMVILGGLKKIAKFCEVMLPAAVLFYLASCLFILITHIDAVPAAIFTVIKSAFTGDAAVGGVLGVTVKEAFRYGIARGVFSNEAGQGSSPIVAAAAKTRNAVRQGLISGSTVFWDTLIICAISGLTVVVAGDWQSGKLFGAALTTEVFQSMPKIGSFNTGLFALSVSMSLFAFSPLVAWFYYTEKAIEYLFKTKTGRSFKVLWLLLAFCGSLLSVKLIWAIADFAISAMAIPNIIALILLRKRIVAITKRFLHKELQSVK